MNVGVLTSLVMPLLFVSFVLPAGARAESVVNTTPSPAQTPSAGDAGLAAMLALRNELKASGDLLGDMRIKQGENAKKKSDLDSEDSRIDAEEARLKSEGTALDLEQQALEAGPKAEYFAAGCRPYEETTDIAFGQRCNAMADVVNDRQTSINERAAPVLARIEKLVADKERLSADTLAWVQETKRVDGEIERLEALVATVQARFAPCGADVTTLKDEELKHRCGNVQFDGAGALPPCDTPACLEFDAWLAAKRNEKAKAGKKPVKTTTLPAVQKSGDPAIPDGKRTADITALEKQRSDLRARQAATEKELEKLMAASPRDTVKIAETKQAISNLQNQVHKVNFDIGEKLRTGR